MRAAFGVFWKALQYWADEAILLVQLNALWFLAQLLIVPGPPATAALMTITNRMAHGELVYWRDAWRAFRRHFWKAWRWGVLNLIFIGVLAYNYIYYTGNMSGILLQAAAVTWALMIATWVAVQLYWWPLILETPGMPVWLSLRNAVRMASAHLLFTAVLVFLALLLTALSVLTVAPALMMTASILALMANHATLDRLAIYRQLRVRAHADGAEDIDELLALEGIEEKERPVVVPRAPKPRARRARSKGARGRARRR